MSKEPRFVLAFIGSVLVLTYIGGRTYDLTFTNFFLITCLFSVLLSSLILVFLEKHVYNYLVFLALTVAFATGGIYLMGCNPWASIIGDNIVYIRDAMRLLQGKSMLDTQYGIGLKFMLIPAIALFPGSVTAMKAVVALTGILFSLFTFLALRELVPAERAFIIAVLSGVIPVVVDYSGQVMADLPYSAFFLLALYVTLRYISLERFSWRWLAGASCAIGWAYHVKAPAMVLMFSAVIYLLLRREVRRGLLLMGGALVWIVPWLVYLQVKYPGRIGYFSSMYAQISRGEHMPDSEIGTFWHNFFYYIFHKNPHDYLNNLKQLFFPFDFPFEGWLVLGLMVLGFVGARRLEGKGPMAVLRSLEVHDWYVMGYMAMLFTLPGSPLRYLIPVLPFFLLYLFKGLEIIVGLVRSGALRKGAPLALALAIFIPSFRSDMDIIAFRRSQKGYPGYWGNYYKVAIWIRDHTPRESRVATRKPTLVWFWSGRESGLYPWTKDVKLAWRKLKGFDYVIVDDLPFFPETRKYLIPVIRAYADSFEVVYVTPPPRNYVLRLKKN